LAFERLIFAGVQTFELPNVVIFTLNCVPKVDYEASRLMLRLPP
jgi:hypothetical protein